MTRKPIDMLDTLDFNSFNLREERWMARTGPRVGDFVLFPGEDEPRRFTHDWDDTIQTTNPRLGDASFHLHKDGIGDFSGSLDSPIPKDKLVDTGKVRPGGFWFFHHERVEAHNGVSCEMPCRVYEYRA